MSRKLSVKNGFVAGFLFMVIFGWLPVGGPILSGFIAGVLTGNGIKRRALTSLLGGGLGTLFIVIFLDKIGYWTLSPLALLLGVGGVESAFLALNGPFLCILGGVLAGSSSRQDVKEKTDSISPKKIPILTKNLERIESLKKEKNENNSLIQYINSKFIEGKIDEEVYKYLKVYLKERLDYLENRLQKSIELEQRKDSAYRQLLELYSKMIGGSVSEKEYKMISEKVTSELEDLERNV